jgi:hypothetical protein
MLVEMHKRSRAYWGWTQEEWMEILCPSSIEFHDRYRHTNRHTRHMLAAALYLLSLFDDFRSLGIIDRTALACRIFGRFRVQNAIQRVVNLIRSWGYGRYEANDIQWAVCTVLLANKSPRLEDLSLEILDLERKAATVRYRRASIIVLSRVLTSLGILSHPLAKVCDRSARGDPRNGVSPTWISWVERWCKTTTLQSSSRRTAPLYLFKAGRWLTKVHPDCVSPECWTRELAAEWVALVCRMKVGEWPQVDSKFQSRRGSLLSARGRAHHLSSLSIFFRDLQEWGGYHEDLIHGAASQHPAACAR